MTYGKTKKRKGRRNVEVVTIKSFGAAMKLAPAGRILKEPSNVPIKRVIHGPRKNGLFPSTHPSSRHSPAYRQPLASHRHRDLTRRLPSARLHLDSSCPAESITFLWVFTYPLTVYPPLILPSILAFIVTTVETIGDVTTTAEVSKLPVEGPEHFQVSTEIGSGNTCTGKKVKERVRSKFQAVVTAGVVTCGCGVGLWRAMGIRVANGQKRRFAVVELDGRSGRTSKSLRAPERPAHVPVRSKPTFVHLEICTLCCHLIVIEKGLHLCGTVFVVLTRAHAGGRSYLSVFFTNAYQYQSNELQLALSLSLLCRGSAAACSATASPASFPPCSPACPTPPSARTTA